MLIFFTIHASVSPESFIDKAITSNVLKQSCRIAHSFPFSILEGLGDRVNLPNAFPVVQKYRLYFVIDVIIYNMCM